MSAPTTAEWLRAAAGRIGDGSAVLAGRIIRLGAKAGRDRAAGVSRWLGQGSGIVDTCLRWGLLYVGGRVLLRVAPGPLHLVAGVWRAIPGAPWWACGVWLVAAYRAGGKPKPTTAQADEDPDPDVAVDLVRQLLDNRPGVHLSAVRERLAAELPHRTWSQADVRQLLADAGVPVRHSVKVRGVGVAVGVHRADLPPLPSPATEEVGEEVEQQVRAATATATPVIEEVGGGAGLVIKPPADRRQPVGERGAA
ncbi:hypothetical protein [Streptomyces sp. NPDC088733]|uniref:hypothetical protein n=1 Tax=Streptomyces sp. NPDC088733 TaxID=3365880 RepID=UPI0037F7B549